jgi:hypothetical protein
VGESTSREAVIRRVRAMLVLAQEDRGATPAEREVAARKAQALAGRHGLDSSSLPPWPRTPTASSASCSSSCPPATRGGPRCS